MQCRLFYEISYLVSAKHSTFSVSDSISTVQTRTPNDEVINLILMLYFVHSKQT